MNNARFEKALTDCGAPLWVFRIPTVESVAVGLLVHAGTRDELWPHEAGLGHALEHMVFQGNRRLPDSYAVSAEIETIGGYSNAWTSKENTGYYCVVPASHFATGVRSIASMINEPTFPEHKIPIEMSNIISEIRGYNDDPAAFCSIKFAEAVYGNHPLGRNELGTEEAVRSFGEVHFRNFMRRLYYPGNYAFVVVGNTSLREAQRIFNDKFLLEDSRYRHLRPHVSLDRTNTQGTSKVYERDVEQANVILGIPLGTARDADTDALRFYNTMIGGGASFPLYQEVRDKRGLCYNIGSGIEPWSDYSLFSVSLGTYPNRMHEAMECIYEVIRSSHCDESLFQRAQTHILGSLDVQLSNPMSIFMQALGDIGARGYPRSPADMRAEIEALTPRDISRAVEKYLIKQNCYTHTYVVPRGTKV